MIPDKIFDQAIDLVCDGNTIGAIKLLRANVSKLDNVFIELTELEGAANELRQDIIHAVINNDESNIRSNRIRRDFLSILYRNDGAPSKTLKRERVKEKVKQSQSDAQYERAKKFFLSDIKAMFATEKLIIEYLESIPERVLPFEKEFNITINCTNVSHSNFLIVFDIGDKFSIGIKWQVRFAYTLNESRLIYTLYNRALMPVGVYMWEQTAISITKVTFGPTINRDGGLMWQSKDGKLLSFDDLDEEIFALIGVGLSI